MKKENIPGWILMLLVGLVSSQLAKIVVVGGKNPIEATALAVILGIILRNTGLVPKVFEPGIKAFEKILILGIVLLGASLNFRNIVSQGPRILLIILTAMGISYLAIYFLGKLFRLPQGLSILLSVGTTICGTSAIAVTAPLIKAKQEEISYAVGTITLWGLVAILFYPKLAQLLGVSDIAFGIFAGTAIHATPQVIGAGFIFSELAGKTATAVKLIRNCFMVPLAFLISVWHTKERQEGQRENGARLQWTRAFPWFLFGYFFMAAFNSLGFLSEAGIKAFSDSGKFLILLGLAGIGLNTVFSSFKSVGAKPLIVGLLGALFVAGCSITLIALIL
jgi:uncharacterized integral membrane protein (TIGR00698 family)